MNVDELNKMFLSQCVNVLRAIEIAKVGGKAVCIYINNNYKNGVADYEKLKSICKEADFFDNFTRNGLMVELHEFKEIKYTSSKHISRMDKIYTSFDMINKNVEKALLLTRPELMSETASTLLLHAKGKLDLSFDTVQKIIEVASYIAMLDNSKTIEVEHIAEAINYLYCDFETCFVPGETPMKFGELIEIKNGRLNDSDIDNAIRYLKQCKQLNSL